MANVEAKLETKSETKVGVKAKGSIKLEKRQVLTMKVDSLSQRFEEYYKNKPNDSYIIQCAAAVLVRNAFSPLDFSDLSKSLIRNCFLSGENLTSVRHLCVYFRPYFNDKEWDTVIARLYKTPQERSEINENYRLHIEKLIPLLHSGECAVEKKHNLKAAFEDGTGKLHNWSLSNVVTHLTPQEAHAILTIFGELTIFQKDGVRQFTRVVWLDYAVDEKHRSFDVRKEDDPLYEPKEDEESGAVKSTEKSVSKDSEVTSGGKKKDSSSSKKSEQQVTSGASTPPEKDTSEKAATGEKNTKANKKPQLSKSLKGYLSKTSKNGKPEKNKKKDKGKKQKNKNKNNGGKKKKKKRK
ncbi:hypothetical protein JZO70_08390 [Enterococcus sp. 669A]|uniref:Uncharacterized protein n=1 Tax=Candidatus Enterococcus moelleringii TaxID=2815325 RepID=A0ABS3L962_9ENTE|nr:hypothetical protein [Enterococcus sp. 669A]MBO1306176.1 hypothetical protein [Enterococcus sp. 669A]